MGDESVRLLQHFFTAFMHTMCSGSCCGDHSCECHMSLHGYHEVMLQTTGYNGTSMLDHNGQKVVDDLKTKISE